MSGFLFEGKLLIASDHAGFDFKQNLKKILNDFQWEDLGCHSTDSVDYPDYAKKLALEIQRNSRRMGVLICGTGIGMCIAANKVAGVRAAVVENPASALLAREHNDAQIICFGARGTATVELAAEWVKIFVTTPASQEPRHRRRVEKLG